jgi:hypothetical protein
VRICKAFIIGALSLLCIPVASTAASISQPVPGKTIQLSSDDWTEVEDETGFAKNYEEKKVSSWHQFGRVVTVYSIPMSVDRQLGLKISDLEYVEFFIVHPGFFTAQTRVNKGKYWILCRETFKVKTTPPVDVSLYKPFLNDAENMKLWSYYQAEVDETRRLLNSVF